MITKDNPSMNSTAESIYMSNSDENIRELCRRREDAIAHEKYQKKKLQEYQEKVETLTEENSALTDENTALTNENTTLTNENTALTDEIARLRKLLEDNNITVE